MCLIAKILACFFDYPVNMINWFSLSQHISFCNKDYISLYQIFQLLSWLCHIGINQTAVIPGSFCSRTAICSSLPSTICSTSYVHSIFSSKDVDIKSSSIRRNPRSRCRSSGLNFSSQSLLMSALPFSACFYQNHILPQSYLNFITGTLLLQGSLQFMVTVK